MPYFGPELLRLRFGAYRNAALCRLELLPNFRDVDVALILGLLRVLAVVYLVPDALGSLLLFPGGVVRYPASGPLRCEHKDAVLDPRCMQADGLQLCVAMCLVVL